MAFTTSQLANQLANNNLQTWASSTLNNQGNYIVAFTNYFNGIQTWITNNGGSNPFGWNAYNGLTHNNNVQVVLTGPAQRAPFNDAFDDVRQHIGTQNFRLFQAAEAIQRLIRVLQIMN